MAKDPTPAQLAARKKFSDAAKAKAAARRAANEQSETSNPDNLATPFKEAEGEQPNIPLSTPPAPHDPGNPAEPDMDVLQRMVLETIQQVFSGVKPQAPTTPSGQHIGENGVVGTRERYPLNPSLYPDPRERISNEARLQPVAFQYNFELEYTCMPTKRYQTQDGIWQIEPQFTLELIRIHRDEGTGEATNERHTVCRGIFFEDPDTSLQMAQDLGYEVDPDNQFEFLNEMRYIRMRDWVFDAFFVPLDTAPKKNKREMVIDGQLVEVWEVSGEEAQTIPFGQLRSKVRG